MEMNTLPLLKFNAESFRRVKSFGYNSYLDHLHLIKSAITPPTTDDDNISETNSREENITNANKSTKRVKSADCFFKSFQFAPDGYAAISWTECNNKFQIWDLNKYCQSELYKSKYLDDSVSSYNFGKDIIANNLDNIQEYFHEVQSGESIYDCKWYPYATTTDVSSYCFASTSRDHPIHIWVCEINIIE